jgi:hypothetical protein
MGAKPRPGPKATPKLSIAVVAQGPERRKKLRKHRLGAAAAVEPELELLGVLFKVLAAHGNVRALMLRF